MPFAVFAVLIEKAKDLRGRRTFISSERFFGCNLLVGIFSLLPFEAGKLCKFLVVESLCGGGEKREEERRQ